VRSTSATRCTSMVLAMLSPQRQMNTPIEVI
jgi:hypothetical protein